MVAVVSDTHLPRGRRSLPEGCVERIRAALDGLDGIEGRVLYVDDGSRDDTWQHIEQAALRYPGLVTPLRFTENRGKRAALNKHDIFLLNRRPGDTIELEVVKRRRAKITLRIDSALKILIAHGGIEYYFFLVCIGVQLAPY